MGFCPYPVQSSRECAHNLVTTSDVEGAISCRFIAQAFINLPIQCDFLGYGTTRTNTIPNGTKANAAGLSGCACVTRMRSGEKGEVWGKRGSASYGPFSGSVTGWDAKENHGGAIILHQINFSDGDVAEYSYAEITKNHEEYLQDHKIHPIFQLREVAILYRGSSEERSN